MADAVKSMTPDELNRMAADKSLVIIDIRDKASYENAHIPGALSVNTEQDIADFLSRTDRKTTVVCCCYHGISSQRVSAYLQAQGFDQAFSLEGGFEGWKSSGQAYS